MDVEEATAVGIAPSQQRGARRRTNRSPGMTVGHAHAFRSESVEVGRLNDLVAVASEIAVAEVVGKKDDRRWAALSSLPYPEVATPARINSVTPCSCSRFLFFLDYFVLDYGG